MNIQGMRRIDNPARIALKDMAEDRRKQNIHVMDKECNVWIITGEQLFTKESRRLNAELGLRSINKFGEKMKRR